MTDATTQALLSVLRSLLIVAGSWFTARGYLSESNTSELIGAITVLAPVVWGALGHFVAERKAAAREVIALTAGMVIADRTDGLTPTIAPVDVPAVLKGIAPQIIVTGKNFPPVVVGPWTAS